MCGAVEKGGKGFNLDQSDKRVPEDVTYTTATFIIERLDLRALCYSEEQA